MTFMDLLPPSFRYKPLQASGDALLRDFSHQPVLAKEVTDFLNPKPGALFFDGTLGGGGHSELLLQAGASVIGCDRDQEALAYVNKRLAKYGDRFSFFESNFAEAYDYFTEKGIQKVNGILLDLGVSSHQLDTADRGFSFQREGPLDMRMGSSGQTAADIVNHAELSELVRIFRKYGNEARAVTMATRIIRERHHRPVTSTLQLAELISEGKRSGPRHPATKIFQALRIAVNDEISSLERALPLLANLLKPGGKFAIITFHSLEDRIVKKFFKKNAAAEIDDPTWPAPKVNPNRLFTLPSPWSVAPEKEELLGNPRSRSARLRMAEKI